MGLRQDGATSTPQPQASSQTTPSQPSTSSSTSQSTPSQLPPAALDLAAKIFDLARTGATDLLDQYLTAGIPLNLTNHEGNTILMLAAYHGHPATVSMLIAHGADVQAVNQRGQTPLAGAVFKGYDDVVRVLVEKGGADPASGRPSAIETAKMFRRDECLRLFDVPESEWRDAVGGITMPRPPPSTE